MIKLVDHLMPIQAGIRMEERKSWEHLNKELQYLWKKYKRDDWQKENLADYCGDLETMIMNYLSRNNALDPNKSH